MAKFEQVSTRQAREDRRPRRRKTTFGALIDAFAVDMLDGDDALEGIIQPNVDSEGFAVGLNFDQLTPNLRHVLLTGKGKSMSSVSGAINRRGVGPAAEWWAEFEDSTDFDFKSVPVLDDDGNEVLDDDGNVKMTVETPDEKIRRARTRGWVKLYATRDAYLAVRSGKNLDDLTVDEGDDDDADVSDADADDDAEIDVEDN